MSAILLLFLGSLLFYFRAPIQQWWTCMRECQPMAEEQRTGTPAEPITGTPVEPTVEEAPAPAVTPLAEQQREYNDFIATEKVGFGSRLTWIAYKYYGEKDLWVFIYEANKENIANPNMLKFGQELRIPRLDKQWTDTSNTEIRQLLNELSDKYLHHQ